MLHFHLISYEIRQALMVRIAKEDEYKEDVKQLQRIVKVLVLGLPESTMN
jgi:hypothetical protein